MKRSGRGLVSASLPCQKSEGLGILRAQNTPHLLAFWVFYLYPCMSVTP